MNYQLALYKIIEYWYQIFMEKYTVKTHTLTVGMEIGPDMVNITGQIMGWMSPSPVRNGTLHVFVVGSTGSVTTIEFEPGVVDDLKRSITDLAPPGQVYAHEQAWHDGNGHSHVQAALMGPSLTLPVLEGKLILGTWQQVVIINHDNSPRTRKIQLTLAGI
ncbi:secondary thiamine-phosphate synthase enzyme YjbQ [Desulfobacula sp.]|uniref:secondary thiamine-phosphate synthase enzyme YjbQ n=1 Tax=Desulfobacula sp. TaxID=2593537 RepID=UPI00260D7309|nr:secondary thiamine-phosphate synthase enzyme YjbQ [Desulfobacula sp.]